MDIKYLDQQNFIEKKVMVKNTEGSLRMTIIFTFNGHWEL